MRAICVAVLGVALNVAACTPADNEPTVVAEHESHPQHLVIDSSYLYWSSEKSVRRTPLAGGSVETVVEEGSLISAFAVDGTTLLVGVRERTSDSRLLRHDLATSATTDLGAITGPLHDVTLTADRIVVNGGSIFGSFPRDRDCVCDLVSLGAARSFAIVGRSVYFVADGIIHRIPIEGGVDETVLEPSDGVRTFAADGERVYWIDGESTAGLHAASNGRRFDLALPSNAGSGVQSLDLSSLSVESGRVWFTSVTGLWYVPGDGSGSPVRVVKFTSVDAYSNVAVSGNTAFVAEVNSGRVLAIALR